MLKSLSPTRSRNGYSSRSCLALISVDSGPVNDRIVIKQERLAHTGAAADEQHVHDRVNESPHLSMLPSAHPGHKGPALEICLPTERAISGE
jgi:hypothetical protein